MHAMNVKFFIHAAPRDLNDFARRTWRACCTTAMMAGLASLITSAAAGIPEPDLVWYGKVSIHSGGTVVRATSGTLVWQVQTVAGGVPWTVSTTLTNINDQFSFIIRVPCESPEPGVAASSNTVVLATPSIAYRRISVTLDGQPLTLQSTGDFTPTLNDRGRPERIDLVLGSLPADSDGDGMSDAWEQQHFGSLNAQPGADADQDGVSNLKEYQAGTNPTDPSSRFELVAIQPVQGGMMVKWSSQPDRLYTVRRSATLTAPPSTYQVVQTGIQATPPINTFVDQSSGSTNSFYIIQVDQ
jgi:hypothetical protein